MKKVYFNNLDGLRFLAFLAIFINHGFCTDDPNLSDSLLYKTLEIIMKPSGLGVPFFFCLSGFLITYLLLVEKESQSKINIGKFYIRRILRIWPLYYSVVIFGFFIFPVIRSIFYETQYLETATLWKYIVFLSNFDQIEYGMPYGAGLGVTWSLSVEEQFYLFWPLLLTIINQKNYLLFFSGIFITSSVFLLFGLPYSNTFGCVSDLSIGAILALLVYKNVNWLELLKKIGRRYIILIYLTGICIVYSWVLFGIGARLLISVFIAFVIFEQCFCQNSILKMGNLKKVSYLGTLSYGFYLLHTISNFIVFNLLKLIKEEINSALALLIQFTLSLLLTLILGYISFNCFEKRFLKMKKRFAVINTSSNKN